jgi:hypothetical protein
MNTLEKIKLERMSSFQGEKEKEETDLETIKLERMRKKRSFPDLLTPV